MSQAKTNKSDSLAKALMLGGLVLSSTISWAASQTRTSAFDYDATTGLLTKEIVEPGNSDLCVVTTYTYDSFGNRKTAETRNCNGAVGSVAPDNSEAAAPTLATSKFTTRTASTNFGASGLFPLTSTNALGQSETKTYDARFGVVTSLTGPNNLTTKWAYDSFGRKVLEQRADGTGTRWKYEYCSGVTVNGAAGPASCPTIAGAVGAYVLTAYPVKSATVTVNTDGSSTDGGDGGANGPYTKTYYDTINRPIRAETQDFDGNADGTINATPKKIFQDTEYNTLGQVSRKSLPYYEGAADTDKKWLLYSYDKLGRVIQTQAPDGGLTKTTYAGLTITVTNPKNQTQTETRNVAGQVVTIKDNNGKTLTKAYDAFGNMVTATDALNNITKLVYDLKGRKTQMIDPDMGTWTYVYDAIGQLVKQTDAKAQVTTMAYDIMGRLTSKSEPSLSANWYFEKAKDGVTECGKGRLCQVTADNGYDRKHVYDSLGRPSSTSTTINNTVYTSSTSYVTDTTSADYGRVKDFTYPSGLKLANVYTKLGFAQKLVSATSPSTVYWRQEKVDAQGHLLQYSYGNSLTTVNDFYADSGLLKSIKVGTNAVVQNTSYTYDQLGNVTSQADGVTGQNANYTYDGLNRLLTETRWGTGITQVNAQTITWDYNEIGNIKSRSDVGTYYYPVAGAARPHAISGVVGTVNGITNPSYNYDANGNITSSAGRTVTWTSFNKINTISGTTGATTNTLAYNYDAEGERVKSTSSKNGALQTTTIYLNPGAGAGLYYEEEIPASGTKKQKHYLSAGGSTIGVLTLTGSTWTTQYWHKDNLGSTVAITNEVGVVTERMAYEPFGKRRNVDETTDSLATLTAINSKRGYTGHEMMDEVGLINMNGRVYDPAIGRFLSADPYIQAPGNLQSYNRYSYVWNNPLNSTDPSGYFNFAKWARRTIRAAILPTPKNLFDSWAAAPGAEQATRFVLKNQWANQLGAIASAAFGGPAASAIWSSYFSYQATGSITAGMRAGATTIATAAAFNWAGNPGDFGAVGHYAAHALVGCASAAAQGGHCGQGAIAQVVSLGITDGTKGFLGSDKLTLGITATIAGGVASEITGGKFGTGAYTAAMGYLFNYLSHEARARLIGAGAFLGGTSGAALAVGCAAGTGGVCSLGAPTIVGAGVAAGAATGGFIANVTDWLDSLIHNDYVTPDPVQGDPERFRRGPNGTRIDNEDGSVWDKNKGNGHGGDQWKRWPNIKDWEKGRNRESVWPDGRIRGD